ncbi:MULTISPECIES: hypothetical protein [Phyllobacteriaceae]|jgi:hypothetical protein|uniref:Transposase n=1 Tax=Mesorhizobium hungaricum TaxID=1566387 RepID=A0A1C2DIB8_9HYPH|nr:MULTISPECIES: hypothetical protein [Mesorhizobium]MBN9234444.1 hypothetical protein [Mesorhizobium sp.]MDQ0332512.1 hypothetical protein [Mesorhizobium sp. YL-MeA3-2017]OCX14477.1 hypothetical protein QV13_18590 [Mesorhizobium hungaricum]
MDRIVRLDTRRETALQRIADRFVASHKGDVMMALKQMIVLNGEMQQRLDTLGDGSPFDQQPRSHH